MSDYTPSTEEVREQWLELWTYDRDAEFDRWLASVKAEAWDEVAAIVENCHDCLTYSGVKNPYRNSQ